VLSDLTEGMKPGPPVSETLTGLCPCGSQVKAYYQAFFRVLIDLIVELFGLIIKPFDNQTES